MTDVSCETDRPARVGDCGCISGRGVDSPTGGDHLTTRGRACPVFRRGSGRATPVRLERGETLTTVSALGQLWTCRGCVGTRREQ